MKSGRLYSLVTKHWPRVAAGLVVVIGLAEFVVGGLTADSGLEFYLFAWAGMTGGLWFLFERSETVLSGESKKTVSAALRSVSFSGALRAVPGQFASLFDRVFGARHLSWRCFAASSAASIAVTATLISAMLAFAGLRGSGPLVELMFSPAGLGIAAVIILSNTLPDYASLLVTRQVIELMRERGVTIRLLWRDFWRSLLIGLVWMWPILSTVDQVADRAVIPVEVYAIWLSFALAALLATLFTSAWLWLYAASVLVSRVLLRMNDGFGFLLRVTDVENQPFRSMGFVSVLIVSGLFLVGLPFVLL